MFKKFFLRALLVCIPVLILLMGGSFFWLLDNNLSTVSGETEYLYVYKDCTSSDIIERLEQDTAHYRVRSLTFLRLDAKLLRVRTIQTGRYAIDPHGSDISFWRCLRGRWQEPIQLTFNNVRTVDQLAGRLASQMLADSTAFLKVLTDSTLLAQYGVNRANAITLFLPNTYEVYWTMSPKDLLDRMAKESDAFWTAERKQLAKGWGLTPQEVYTLASIVESETAQQDEKARVAGLYLNRLKKGMLLQSDPTAIFALRAFKARRVTNDMLEVDSPYNTYKYRGLPPGPIRMATCQGIDAVLHAEKHQYIFMCARETFDGHHNFAVTFAEHKANAQRYQAELNKRNIH